MLFITGDREMGESIRKILKEKGVEMKDIIFMLSDFPKDCHREQQMTKLLIQQ